MFTGGGGVEGKLRLMFEEVMNTILVTSLANQQVSLSTLTSLKETPVSHWISHEEELFKRRVYILAILMIVRERLR